MNRLRNDIMKKELEIFLKSTKDGVVSIDKNCIITLYNIEAEKIIGVPRKDAVGKHVNEVIKNSRLPSILKTGEHEIDWQQEFNSYYLLASRMPIKNEDGKAVGAIAVFRNITDIMNLDKQITNLKEYQSLLQAVFDSAQDAISVVDDKGIHIMVNRAYTKLTGITEQEIIGKTALYDIEEGESLHNRVLKTGRPVKNTKLITKPSGKKVVAQAAPIVVGDKLKGSVAVLHDVTEIRELTDKLHEAQKRIRELSSKYSFDDIIGTSEKLTNIKIQAKKAAKVPATVLLRGESGTGKELFAHAIHSESSRKYNQFVRVNCASLTETLLESELFGYEEGSFTGAKKGGKKGLFEEADNGTIFLDEISEISMSIQVKLLRVLQEREILRVGGVTPIPINVRIIAATNVDLKKAVKKGKFREDLYYRLNVYPITLPPLRERKEDIQRLAVTFIKKFNNDYGRNVNHIAKETLELLHNYEWPGNVRELENIIGRSMINMNYNEQVINIEHLPFLTKPTSKKIEVPITVKDEEIETLDSIVSKIESKYIKEIYDKFNKNKKQTAEKLGISIRSLYYKMEKYDMK